MALNFFQRHRAKIVFAGPDDCWLWTAGKYRNGYGQLTVDSKKRLAHREAYEDANGKHSAHGLVVRHKCDVKSCVNPAHLEPGTVADNNRDMIERGGHRYVAHQGEANGRAKITEDHVRTIRAAYVRGSSEFGLRALAEQFGVTQVLVSRVVRRKAWSHAV